MATATGLRLPFHALQPAKAWLEAQGAVFESAPHAHFRARLPGAVITLYHSGKALAQGPEGPQVWAALGEALGLRDGQPRLFDSGEGAPRPSGASLAASGRSGGAAERPEASAVATPGEDVGGVQEKAARSGVRGAGPFGAALRQLPTPTPAAWIGIDETGKGDFFGPLVVAAACVRLDQLALLAELGVGDSKAIDDRRVEAIAAQLEHVVVSELLVLMPPQYNELYGRIGNLNHLLAWGHATVGAKLAAKTDAALVLSDQFAKRDLITSRLRRQGCALPFLQRTRAEDDPAVGAASILARARFLGAMRSLEKSAGVRLHKGAGPPVIQAGRVIVAQHGRDKLAEVAKLHFKTMESL